MTVRETHPFTQGPRCPMPHEQKAITVLPQVIITTRNDLIQTGSLTPLSTSPGSDPGAPPNLGSEAAEHPPNQIKRSASEELLPTSAHPRHATYAVMSQKGAFDGEDQPTESSELAKSAPTERSVSPPMLSANDAVSRAKSLSKKLSLSQIPTHVTDTGDLMLDMTGYKSSEDEALRAEVIARKILSEELEGNYDIGALIGADEQGNLWIYSSEEAKEAAGRKIGLRGLATGPAVSDAASDPGYQSDEENFTTESRPPNKHRRTLSASNSSGLVTPPQTPPAEASNGGDGNKSFAKTLRLTSDQLKALNLKSGMNTVSFSVNRATCQACMYYWTYDVPIVISDIDGTITK